MCLRFLLLINLTVSAFATQLGKIGFAYPDFVIIVAISLWKPYAKLESGTNLAQILYKYLENIDNDRIN